MQVARAMARASLLRSRLWSMKSASSTQRLPPAMPSSGVRLSSRMAIGFFGLANVEWPRPFISALLVSKSTIPSGETTLRRQSATHLSRLSAGFEPGVSIKTVGRLPSATAEDATAMTAASKAMKRIFIYIV